MRITVICVGKIKEKFYTDALAEYRKRLSKYCKLEIVELADEKTKENASAHEIELVKAKEGERILSAIKEDMYVIALAIEGKMLDSVELSEKIEKLVIYYLSFQKKEVYLQSRTGPLTAGLVFIGHLIY